MPKKMLIDTAHAEETRVVVIDGSRIEEFDFENHARKQLRGNIYLAKVTRVEPSLQAAFVEYGGNRHGFLAFNEIHPDYYQIPSADREALLREEAEENEALKVANSNGRGRRKAAASSETDAGVQEPGEDDGEGHDVEDRSSAKEEDEGDEEIMEAAARQRRRLMRRYKIQEVIKRRQILLVQVVKEERGNKGAALTTYMSLAGRYGVLMPNTAKGGGISRKIESATDRKRLKTIVQGLEIPEGMGLIVRTAGASRTKAEIKRDYEYLLRLWESIREVTLRSIAPALIYEEEDLVKRAVRDMYDKDYEGIIVEGEEGYKEARDFMRMLMPSQVKKVTSYKEPLPLFVRHKVEDQLSQIHSPVVPLKSGGYLVINQTEALVAIDVNSGKSTRERGIEATALKTNMEAAEEAARQLRLRDLAGLIVIDFIDMDESKNNRAVEKKLKDALAGDRARLQMGKISPFGLMEISRQRRRTGVLEGTTHVCPSCQGLGRIRSTESSALSALRSVEIEFARDGGGTAVLRVASPVALYILNEKRAYLTRLEQVQGLHITVINDDTLHHAEHLVERLSSTGAPPAYIEEPSALASAAREESDESEEDEIEAEDEDEADAPAAASDESEEARRGRRRRRTRGGRGRSEEGRAGGGQADEADSPVQARESAGPSDEPLSEEERNRRRRRGRRGGRRTREEGRAGAEPYAWTRARSPDGEDPYGWFDPLPPIAQEPPAAAALSEPLVAANDPDEPATDAQAAMVISDAQANSEAQASDGDETPAGRAPRKRSPRGGRGRGRRGAEAADAAPSDGDGASEASTEAGEAAPPAVEAEPIPQGAEIVEFPLPEPRPEPVTDDAEAAPEPLAAQAPAAVAEAEPASVEAAEPDPAPMAEREPDPAEISAPPVQPRRGWWRRGG